MVRRHGICLKKMRHIRFTTQNRITFLGEEIDFNGGVATRVENLAIMDMLSSTMTVQDRKYTPDERGFW